MLTGKIIEDPFRHLEGLKLLVHFFGLLLAFLLERRVRSQAGGQIEVVVRLVVVIHQVASFP